VNARHVLLAQRCRQRIENLQPHTRTRPFLQEQAEANDTNHFVDGVRGLSNQSGVLEINARLEEFVANGIHVNATRVLPEDGQGRQAGLKRVMDKCHEGVAGLG